MTSSPSQVGAEIEMATPGSFHERYVPNSVMKAFISIPGLLDIQEHTKWIPPQHSCTCRSFCTTCSLISSRPRLTCHLFRNSFLHHPEYINNILPSYSSPWPALILLHSTCHSQICSMFTDQLHAIRDSACAVLCHTAQLLEQCSWIQQVLRHFLCKKTGTHALYTH